MEKVRILASTASRFIPAAALGLFMLLVAAAATTRAVARDIDALIKIVVPAYTAMDFATICREDDPRLLWDTRGPRGTVLHYAKHVKDEVITSLSHDEAVTVLTRAAESARATTREELKKVSLNYPTRRPGEIIGWCKGTASNFIRAFITRHDANHESLLEETRRAKQ
ncbi:MAG: hypothetical protein U1E81_21435 [Xanthobacteraceae bacterium]